MMKLSLLLLALSATTEAFVVSPATKATTATTAAGPFHPPVGRSIAPSTQLHSFFSNIFEGTKKKAPVVKQPVYDNVVIDPDYRVAFLFLVLGAGLDFIPYIQLTLGPLITALGLLFLFQTFRIRIVFDEDNCIELKTALTGTKLKSSGENVVVGGANRWSCDTIVNYDFFPKGWMEKDIVGPVLVYFKETATDESTWNDGPGKAANDPEKIASGKAVGGQVHFFPVVGNAQQIRAEFEKRGCGKIED